MSIGNRSFDFEYRQKMWERISAQEKLTPAELKRWIGNTTRRRTYVPPMLPGDLRTAPDRWERAYLAAAIKDSPHAFMVAYGKVIWPPERKLRQTPIAEAVARAMNERT